MRRAEPSTAETPAAGGLINISNCFKLLESKIPLENEVRIPVFFLPF
jgi:hypothetical protein